MASGLWHQTQASVHPLKKTVVLMPGPSSSELGRTSTISGRRRSSGDEDVPVEVASGAAMTTSGTPPAR